MPGSFDGTMNSSMTIFGGPAATVAKQKPPAASAASDCRMIFTFPPWTAVAEFCAFLRRLGQVHGKGEGLSRGSDRRRGRELPQHHQSLLDRRVDAVHVEDRGARALARDGVDEGARDFSGVEPRHAPGERHLVGLARGGGENRDGRLGGEALVAPDSVYDARPDSKAMDAPVLRIDL